MKNKIRLSFVVSLLSIINGSAILFIASLEPPVALIVSTMLSALCAIVLLWIYVNWK